MLTATNIITITMGGLLYRDPQGITRWVDFYACREWWLQRQAIPAAIDRRYVGTRTENTPQLRVQFFTYPPVIFTFADAHHRNRVLLTPMGELGWFTRTRPNPIANSTHEARYNLH